MSRAQGDVRARDGLDETLDNPWPALWALVLGFFMIMVDASILTVATPALISDLGAEVNEAIWVTSAYLLTYAVPLLITGRLGDRYGPKRIYLVGLVVFTASSLWCGLADDVTSLVAARAVQGLGAALMSPQTMAMITRIFPAAHRGQAMALWGATAGVATMVGPLLGGFLVGAWGWEWIFFINVPVGVVAFVAATRLLPDLTTHQHRFDWLGVLLFGSGMFGLVFGIQEGHQYDWGRIDGPVTVWRLIIGGVGLLALFVFWQSRNRAEPLLPLSLFRDRNFSVANLAIATVSFSFMTMGFPLMLYAQSVREWTPFQAGMLMTPLAVGSIVLARLVGGLTDREHPRTLTVFGFACAVVATAALALALDATTPVWVAVAAISLLGVGSAFLWGPLSATANRNLPMHQAGAGSGVYNSTRQVASTLGAAVAALVIEWRLEAYDLPTPNGGGEAVRAAGPLDPALAVDYSAALAQSLWALPVAFTLGLVAVLFFERPRHFDEPG
ncbi:MFS transporter [Nocardioides daphniae]|uniref:MFS transporter n=1 Tax=Nocardioides daphniae TaxID=402297 RepID=A0ABQ1PZM3_9ACTN|nr:MFS transporter [Nocardioides daphniae]GGD08144.1 MFS transporter [Nocardioides daphniae]